MVAPGTRQFPGLAGPAIADVEALLGGDVRLGSMKRVAAAVGEGSSAVRGVHEYLSSAG